MQHQQLPATAATGQDVRLEAILRMSPAHETEEEDDEVVEVLDPFVQDLLDIPEDIVAPDTEMQEMQDVLDGPDFDDVRSMGGLMRTWATVLMDDVDWTSVTDAHLTPRQCKNATGFRLTLGYGRPLDVTADAVLAYARSTPGGAELFERTVTGEPLQASHVQLFFDRPNVRQFFEGRR